MASFVVCVFGVSFFLSYDRSGRYRVVKVLLAQSSNLKWSDSGMEISSKSASRMD